MSEVRTSPLPPLQRGSSERDLLDALRAFVGSGADVGLAAAVADLDARLRAIEQRGSQFVFRAKEAGVLLGVSERTVMGWWSSGVLEYTMVGGVRKVTRPQIDAFLERGRVGRREGCCVGRGGVGRLVAEVRGRVS